VLKVRLSLTTRHADVSAPDYVVVLSLKFLTFDKSEIMKTSDEQVIERTDEQLPATSEVIVTVDWTETDWFKTWLKLARHEPVDRAA
jgi:hypothetical protein